MYIFNIYEIQNEERFIFGIREHLHTFQNTSVGFLDICKKKLSHKS